MSAHEIEFPEPGAEPKTGRSSEHWAFLTFSILGWLAMLGFAFFLEPDGRGYGTHEQLGLKPCFPQAYWNFPCPGCGVTTAVTHTAHFQWWQALKTQPFGLLLGVLGPLFGVWAIYQQLRGRDIWMEVAMRGWERLWMPALVALLLSWLYKIAMVRAWF